MIDVAALGMPEKGDIVDWLTLHPGATLEDIYALPRVVTTDSSGELGASAPEPLRRPVPAPEPYPIAELGTILGPACASLRRVIQASEAVCGASLLASASLAVQGLANVTIDGRNPPLSLWFLTVAESGERKSAVDAEAMASARAYEKELTLAYTEAAASYAAQAEEWNARREAAKADTKKQKGEGLASKLQALGEAPESPLRPTLICADFTAEGLAKLLAVSRPSLGVFSDEAALVFGGHGMTKETTARTAATLSKLWDSGTLDRVRASEGAAKLYGRRLALHLMAQPVIAERALSDEVLSGQGFLARCLLAWPESTAGSRPYRAENLSHDPALVHYRARCADLLARPLPIAPETRNELAPPVLELDAAAFEVYRALHDRVEAAMGPSGRFVTVKPWASKTPEQALRIAGVLTLFEDPSANAITASTMERASELALWHLSEAARLAGTAALSAEVRDAEALLNWCHTTNRTMLHSVAALQLGPARIRERERFIQSMGELERAGWAKSIEGGAVIDGKHRRNVWRIVPESEGR